MSKVSKERLQEIIDDIEKYHNQTPELSDMGDLLPFEYDETISVHKELKALRKEIDRVALFLAVHGFSGYKIVEE